MIPIIGRLENPDVGKYGGKAVALDKAMKDGFLGIVTVVSVE